MPYVQLALGASMSQTDENPYLQNLRLRTHWEKFPQSPHIAEVRSWHEDIRAHYGAILLSEARLLVVKQDYPEAMRKLDMILRWGSVLPVFEESLYTMVEVSGWFVMGLLNKSSLSDFRINEFLGKPWNSPVTPEQREAMAQDVLKVARKYAEQMRQNLPNSPWTKKLKEWDWILSETDPVWNRG
ncbi:MAG: hypothetical protein N2578_04990 [Bdellovibrionaceae bacterium]|nr:hypothetical protein [Pseudobdellovibrionaceae bacterium]